MLSRRLPIAAAVAAMALPAFDVAAAGAAGAPPSLRLGGPGPGVRQMLVGPGDPFVVRGGARAPAKAGRAARRRSLLYFAHLTDPHTVDEMSPARAEFLDTAGRKAAITHRPQEALSTHVLDQMVRAVNRNRVSRISGAPMALSLMTGDASDNAQLNEARLYVRTLEGGTVDPFSGRPIGPGNPCPGASAAEVNRLNAAVAARAYTGVQDLSDYRSATPLTKSWFWDPDTGAHSGRYRGVRYPGLMDRAQQPFQAEGLAVPWFASRGNHDTAKQGVTARSRYYAGRATGCRKVFPGTFNSRRLSRLSHAKVFARLGTRGLLGSTRRDVRLVPPDLERRPVSKAEFKRLHGSRDRSHGFGHVAPVEQRRSRGSASYYAFTPRPGMRFISLDTSAEAGGFSGNVDHPQYRWLARELDHSSSVRLPAGRGKARRDRDRDRLVVVFAHHTLATMGNPNPDESMPRCRPGLGAACDSDPRSSRPLHQGLSGRRSLRSLLLRHPNVIALVVGHSHRNHVRGFGRRDRRAGFWQLNTASHIDFPQQSRLIELMDNRDGTLSIFGSMLDHAAPAAAPRPGTPAARIPHAGLASLSRVIAAPFASPGIKRGGRLDRNVELLVRDPRRR